MNKTKILALHLPQYYETEENNIWWGKGFTDWVNVRKASPLYEGHVQPIVPKDAFYYDMSDISTITWQTKLAKEYGIYGFCYYHYWFGGKLILEKPCEILHENPEIDTNYCFCWANESWIRTWKTDSHNVLVKQEYGERENWIQHIKYLSDFFTDSRYIKVDSRPVLFIYCISDIPKWNEMLQVWNEYLACMGIESIYVVEFITANNSGKEGNKSDAICEFQPHAVARYNISLFYLFRRFIRKKTGKTDFLDYDYLWKCLLNNRRNYGEKPIIKSTFVSFDNTARKLEKALITKGASPEKFEKYLQKLINLNNRKYVTDFVVINAWNEWAEGAVLEPTEQFGYGYLEAIRNQIL